MAKLDEGETGRFLRAWFQVRQLIQAANFNHFHKAGLSATQFMILNVLPPAGEALAMGELARLINLKPATLAGTIDTLESRGMVARRKSDADRRLVLVGITPAGSKLQNASAGQFRRYIADIFSRVAAGDRAALIRGLESLAAAADPRQATRAEDASGPAKRNSRRSPKP